MATVTLDHFQAGRSTALRTRSGKALAASDPDRLIAIGRLVTSLFAVVAVYLDPTQPARYLEVSATVLGFYVLFAVAIVFFPTQRPLDSEVHLISHGVDVIVLGGLSFLTNELTSPFFAFLPFILLATTMRWGMGGAIFGAIVLEVVLILVGWPDLEDGESELNILIMRSAYLIVAAGMLGYFGASREGSLHRLARLADWPSDGLTSDRYLWLRNILQHTADVLGEARLLVVWQGQEEPRGSVAYCAGGKLELRDITDPRFWADQNLEISAPLRSFAARPSQVEQVDTLIRSVPELDRCSPQPSKLAYSAAFSGIRYKGRLFVLDPGCGPEESASLTDIIAARIGSELERLALMEQIAVTARSQERVRLARDLHDSILQDLTAAGLKLKAASSRVPVQARPELGMVSAMLLDQQRRIRMFVEHVHFSERAEQPVFSALINESVQALGRQWSCTIRLRIEPPDARVSPQLSTQVVQLLSEATANAVRHGGATTLDVEAVRREKELTLKIEDNGTGMGREGSDAGTTPMSLAGRVSDLGGTLSIVRHTPGLAMHIRLPIPEADLS